jgi:hypothetical protein
MGPGRVGETEDHMTGKRYRILVISLWVINVLMVIGVVPIWLVVVMHGMAATGVPSDIHNLWGLVICGVPVSILVFLICTATIIISLIKDRNKPALIAMLVSMGATLLPVLPFLVFSLLNPTSRYSFSL